MSVQVVAWMVHGLLLDNHEEFFIKEDADIADSAAEQYRVVAFESMSDEAHWEKRLPPVGVPVSLCAPCAWKPTVGAAAWWMPVVIVEGGRCRFSIRQKMLPAYISASVAERVLFVGKALRFPPAFPLHDADCG